MLKWPRVGAYISIGAEVNHLGNFKDGTKFTNRGDVIMKLIYLTSKNVFFKCNKCTEKNCINCNIY